MRRLINSTLIILSTSILATITAGCTLFPTGEPTPRPTYTPYPTIAPNPTSMPRPTYTPHPTSDQAPTLRPTYTPYPTFTIDQVTNIEVHRYHSAGTIEYFDYPAATAIDRGQEMLRNSENEAALRKTLGAIAQRSRATEPDIERALEQGFAQGVAQALTDGIMTR